MSSRKQRVFCEYIVPPSCAETIKVSRRTVPLACVINSYVLEEEEGRKK